MNRDVLESQWVQIRQILREKFSNLTEEDIRQIGGRYDQLVAKLQQKYGYSREEAEEKIRNWNFDRFTTSKDETFDEEKTRGEGSSSFLKWALPLGLALLLLGLYFSNTSQRSPTQEQLAVEAPADRAISNNLRNALVSQNITTELQNIQITTQNGVVTLSGFVSNRETRDAIVATAQNIAGVRQVINNLQTI